MSLQAALERADQLVSKGLYFDAHEEMEEYWMKTKGPEKILLQGLIQLAAGLHRLEKYPAKTEGAFYLLDRGMKKLLDNSSLLEPGGLAILAGRIAEVRLARKAPETLPFGLKEKT